MINAADKKPVPYASVFLSNSVVGARTNDDGTFSLTNVRPGQYDLVISFIGFETHHQTIIAENGTLALTDIAIIPKTTQLKEVTIGPPDPHRNENLDIFIKAFLGRSANAAQCKIVNPDAINISFDAGTRILSASSDEFLIIENKALGYKVHYQLNKFSKDYLNNFTYYEGSVLFEDIAGKPSQHKKWLKNRLEDYKGSDMHFLRSIFADRLTEEGFRTLKLIRKPNPARPPDSQIRAKLRYFALRSHSDSLSVWQAKLRLPKMAEYLVKTPMPINNFVKRTDHPNMLALQYADYLYIIYTKKPDQGNNGQVYQPIDMPTYPTSIIGLNTTYAAFDSNGVFIDPTATTYEGEWTNHGVADLLPVDYDPAVKKPD